MCFGSSAPAAPTPSKENEAAAEARVEADVVGADEASRRAAQKRDDITEALSSRDTNKNMRGGSGRKSLFSTGGQGFLGRFD
jgi:hypothetical protein|tara:strand:- start:2985 stop:3230 length:246 start_codon:yes stop_codon:yes gene_type:complete